MSYKFLKKVYRFQVDFDVCIHGFVVSTIAKEMWPHSFHDTYV